jgi:hypothetical protein
MKLAIVDTHSLIIVSTYESSSSLAGTSHFGGPWNNDPRFLHIEIPVNIVNSDNLHVVEELITVGYNTSLVLQDGEPKMVQAYDADGEPLLDADGYAILVPKYIGTPRTEKRLKIVAI